MISVFGSSGFVGSHFIRNSRQHCISIDRDSIIPATREVLYLISTTHNYHPQTDCLRDINTNLIHLMEVLRNLREGDVFNFVSSWFVYGKAQDWVHFPAQETSPCDPRGFYSITKHCAEKLIRSYCDMRGIHWRIFRLSNVFGPGDRPSEKKNALQFFLEKVRRGESFPLYWGGDCLRDYIHVRDVVRALDHLMLHSPSGQITNVGSGEPTKIGQLLRHAIRHTGSKSEITYVEPTIHHEKVQTRNFRMDCDLLKRTGPGFEASVPWRKGIEELCDS